MRLKIALISKEAITDWIIGKSHAINWPKDAKVIELQNVWEQQCLGIVLESSEWPEVKKGNYLEKFFTEFDLVELSTTKKV